MSSARLYYTDASCLDFTATVIDQQITGSGARVVLDQTAFYPTTGGQPHDTGTLGGVRVVDVIDDDEGRVVHLLEQPLGPDLLQPGAQVHGLIDRARRLDHMQQHSGQHVLSAAFDRLIGVRTVSFHLGLVTSTMDLVREVMPAEIAAAEDAANRVVWDDRPVTIRFTTAEEAAQLPLRKESVREGILRLIDMGGFDLSACGGTHVSRTGEIGVIAVRTWERFKGGARLEFVCGARALASYRELRDASSAASRQLSVLPNELAGAIERLQTESRDQRRQMRSLTEQLARYHARDVAARAERIGAVAVVVEAMAGYDANGLKVLAASIVSEPCRVAVLFTAERPALGVVARSADVGLDASALLKRLNAQFGGKGGGKPDLAQAGGLDAPTPEIVATAQAIVFQMLGAAGAGR
jgi:alanyl-tRNA synthetase